MNNNQCHEIVYVRDTFRRTGRGQGGFEMHYNRQQCQRNIKRDKHCWQHLRRCQGSHVDGYYHAEITEEK